MLDVTNNSKRFCQLKNKVNFVTCSDSKTIAMMKVPTQLVTAATPMALGLGACLNNSAPIIKGIGPENRTRSNKGWLDVKKIHEHPVMP